MTAEQYAHSSGFWKGVMLAAAVVLAFRLIDLADKKAFERGQQTVSTHTKNDNVSVRVQ